MAFQPQGAYQTTRVSGNGSGDAILGRPGQLHSVTINSKGLTGNTITLYDSLTHGAGTTIAVIDTTAQIQTLIFDAWLQTGLSYTMASGTAGDVAITYT
jgi:hypothetical protein